MLDSCEDANSHFRKVSQRGCKRVYYIVVQRACEAPRLAAHAPTIQPHPHRPRGGLQAPGAARFDDQPASTAPTLLRRLKTEAFQGQAAFDQTQRGEPAEGAQERFPEGFCRRLADVCHAGAPSRCRHTC